MAATLLDQLKIASAVRETQSYRTSDIKLLPIPPQDSASDSTAQLIVLMDSLRSDLEARHVKAVVFDVIRRTLKEGWQGRSLRDQVIYALQQANRALFTRAFSNQKVGQLGASIMIAILTADREGVAVEIIYIGNCRAYLVRGGKRYFLTVEHTYGQEYARRVGVAQPVGPVATGWYQPTRYLGAASDLKLEQFVDVPKGDGTIAKQSLLRLEPDDQLILCTIGIPGAAVEHILPTIGRSRSSRVARAIVNYKDSTLRTTDAASVVIARYPRSVRWGLLLIWLFGAVLFLLAGIYWGGRNGRGHIETWPLSQLVLPVIGGTPTATPTVIATPLPTVPATSPPVPILTAIRTATPSPTATFIATPAPTATRTDTPMPMLTVASLSTLPPTSTPTATRTPTATPIPTASPTATATAQPAVSPTATSVLTPVSPAAAILESEATITESGGISVTRKSPPTLFEPRPGEKAYPTGATDLLLFRWSATSDATINEVYHVEIRTKDGNALVYSNNPVLEPGLTEETQVPILTLQGKNWLQWRVRTGIVQNGEFVSTSDWSKAIEFKVTESQTSSSGSAPPTPPK
ncbi:MAG: hypothetical protein R3E79_14765 [Caldilineaceae bacterium]